MYVFTWKMFFEAKWICCSRCNIKEERMKRFFTLLLVAMLTLSAVFAGGSKEGSGDGSVVLRVSMAEAASDNKAVAIESVKAKIEERTEGRVRLEIYCNGELGTFQEDVEAITQGANIVDGTSPSAYCDYGCYDMMALDLMRMIKSPEECDILNDSELFKEMCDQIEAASGIKVIAINWPNQPRCILSAKPINSVADINGLIIRVPSAPYVAFFTRLGAAPVSMSMADTYTAMQQGSADACEFPLTTIYTNSLYEVGKYCYLSEHTYAPSMWCMNANIFNSLSEADQQVILEEFEAGGKEFAALNESNLAEYRQMLEAQGVAFVEPSAEDIAIMDQAAVDSAADFPGLSDGIIEKVEAALGR